MHMCPGYANVYHQHEKDLDEIIKINFLSNLTNEIVNFEKSVRNIRAKTFNF